MKPLYNQNKYWRFKNTALLSRLFVLLIISFQIPAVAKTACGNNPQATELAQLIQQHPKQSRKHITCSSKLAAIAKHKADLLSQNDIIMHNIGHLTPNQLLRDNGYPLNGNYPILGNQVEALAAGKKDAKATFKQLLNSETHRSLLLGKASFYLPQNEIGVAYLKQNNAPYEHYWVIYLADTNNRPKPQHQYTVNYESPYDPQNNSKKNEKMSIRERLNRSRNTRPMMATDN